MAIDQNFAGNTGKVMIVGDDDQSICGWRCAKSKIFKIPKRFQMLKPFVWSKIHRSGQYSEKCQPTYFESIVIARWKNLADRR